MTRKGISLLTETQQESKLRAFRETHRVVFVAGGVRGFTRFFEGKVMDKLWAHAVCLPPERPAAAKGGRYLLIFVPLLGIDDGWSIRILNLRVWKKMPFLSPRRELPGATQRCFRLAAVVRPGDVAEATKQSKRLNLSDDLCWHAVRTPPLHAVQPTIIIRSAGGRRRRRRSMGGEQAPRSSKLARLSTDQTVTGDLSAATPLMLGLGLGLGLSSGGSGRKAAFTFMQMQELEQQALIYKYMAAGLPVPLHLVLPIWKSVAASASSGRHCSPRTSSFLHQP
ncbi:Growth-regulating factor 12 [Apostasia shenzhenica]|uniref:Growth-regulating factor n=1 Tax=Apostasia shenzhenica TaxID=1088818 RepID=A0A2I0AF85_9ASPA|nr:Growth-regulating factor 12 [Apostasia shenzhenica]